MKKHRQVRAALVIAAAICAARFTFAAVAPVPTLADCDAPGSATMLLPVAAIDARAYWLDRQRLQWPGAEAAGRFKLYFSGRGAIVAAVGSRVAGADGALVLAVDRSEIASGLRQRFKFIGDGVRLAARSADLPRLPALHRQQLVLVQEDESGTVRDATALQAAGALDDLNASAEQSQLGATARGGATRFALWAPTAQAVWLCRYDTGSSRATHLEALRPNTRSGVWSLTRRGRLDGQYYTYLVDVFTRAQGGGFVRNRVTDPYSLSLTTDSQRSYIADLNARALKPTGWDATPRPDRVKAATDLVIYELHVRDFSIGDASAPAPHRGKYLAFTDSASNGMQHLQRLSTAGVTDVHLLPVFDIASVPERGCTSPAVPVASPDSEAQQAAVMKEAANDCYNWGYDPWHYTAPEGSYASDASDGAVRIREFRAMVQALHRAGLRVGMDMVYNHTSAAGQDAKSVLDRIVPGYYHRLDAKGAVEHSTCCDNTATEQRMMAKLMIDSAVVWARDHKIDSFRFDLMGHQPREAMERLQRAVDAAAGRHVHLLGEGWNFGEVKDGARFVQAAQGSLAGTGIASFSDRARDAARGGGCCDNGPETQLRQGWLNGLFYDPNAQALASGTAMKTDLLRAADLARVGLAGTLRDYRMRTHDGGVKTLAEIDYAGQRAGFASQPDEVVNYVENHDGRTLFDINVLKLPVGTSREDRARVQVLGLALTAFSQGLAYFHAGVELLRSKSGDRDSFDSGDWFNRLDWTATESVWGSGLPPKGANGNLWPALAPLLADPAVKPTGAEIRFTRDALLDLLRIRGSSTLFRLRTADEVAARLTLPNTGPTQVPTVLVGLLDGRGHPGAGFEAIVYLINVDKLAQRVTVDAAKGQPYMLHPVQQSAQAADQRLAREASFEAASGSFTVPARTAAVFVVKAPQ